MHYARIVGGELDAVLGDAHMNLVGEIDALEQLVQWPGRARYGAEDGPLCLGPHRRLHCRGATTATQSLDIPNAVTVPSRQGVVLDSIGRSSPQARKNSLKPVKVEVP